MYSDVPAADTRAAGCTPTRASLLATKRQINPLAPHPLPRLDLSASTYFFSSSTISLVKSAANVPVSASASGAAVARTRHTCRQQAAAATAAAAAAVNAVAFLQREAMPPIIDNKSEVPLRPVLGGGHSPLLGQSPRARSRRSHPRNGSLLGSPSVASDRRPPKTSRLAGQSHGLLHGGCCCAPAAAAIQEYAMYTAACSDRLVHAKAISPPPHGGAGRSPPWPCKLPMPKLGACCCKILQDVWCKASDEVCADLWDLQVE